MQAWIALALSISLPAPCLADEAAAPTIKRSIHGISTGMAMEQAWIVAIKNGGQCQRLFLGRSEFSCRFDRLTLFVYKTVFMKPALVQSLSITFQPSQMGADLPAFMQEQFGIVREVDPNGRPLPWQRLESGEMVQASCFDKAPGNTQQPLSCRVTLTDTSVGAADRDIAMRRE